MKIYRLHTEDNKDESQGYEFFTSKKAVSDAMHGAAQAGWKTSFDGPHEIPLTKAGVLAALQKFGGHPDNG